MNKEEWLKMVYQPTEPIANNTSLTVKYCKKCGSFNATTKENDTCYCGEKLAKIDNQKAL